MQPKIKMPEALARELSENEKQMMIFNSLSIDEQIDFISTAQKNLKNINILCP